MVQIYKLKEHPEFKEEAAQWFHNKWQIPQEAYAQSIAECLQGNTIPQWYVAIDHNKIIGGIGVIANDIHNRKDLTPNVCALYVEEDYRNKKIAKKLLETVIEDMRSFHFKNLYLITDHTNFYERFGWQYLCHVQEECTDNMVRMYVYNFWQHNST